MRNSNKKKGKLFPSGLRIVCRLKYDTFIALNIIKFSGNDKTINDIELREANKKKIYMIRMKIKLER